MSQKNPFIIDECAKLEIATNNLDTFLQPQFGQLGEDLVLDSIICSLCVRHSVPFDEIRYLDVGANHPVQTSNTYLLQKKHAASGVLIEANPSILKNLRAVRSKDIVLNAAVVPKHYTQKTVEIFISDNSELSSVNADHVHSFGEIGIIKKTETVKAVYLDDILAEYFTKPPQLLSIDIEGLDLDVLMSSRFPVRPWVIVCEPSRHFFKNSDVLFDTALLANNYFEVARTAYNIIYIDFSLITPGFWRRLWDRMKAINHVRLYNRRLLNRLARENQ